MKKKKRKIATSWSQPNFFNPQRRGSRKHMAFKWPHNPRRKSRRSWQSHCRVDNYNQPTYWRSTKSLIGCCFFLFTMLHGHERIIPIIPHYSFPASMAKYNSSVHMHRYFLAKSKAETFIFQVNGFFGSSTRQLKRQLTITTDRPNATVRCLGFPSLILQKLSFFCY